MNIKRKTFTFFLVVIAFGLSSATLTANAYVKKADTTVYTLTELYNMNKEDFFQLEVNCPELSCKDGKSLYLQIKQDISDNSDDNDITITFYNEITKSKKYQAGITEKNINELFGEELKEQLVSPLYFLDYIFNGYDGGISSSIYISDNVSKNDEEILKAAKRFYCVNQVMDMEYLINSAVPGGETLKLEWGDINLDNKVDLADAAYINKGLSGIYELTQGQKYIGDINNDGRFDILDSISIKKQYVSENEKDNFESAVNELISLEKLPIPGDISQNGNIDLYDAIAVAENLVGKRNMSYTEKLIADHNSDLKVDLYDAIAIAEILVQNHFL